MNILKAVGTDQALGYYVRPHTGDTPIYTALLIDESLNKTTALSLAPVYSEGILSTEVAYEFIEGRFYGLKTYADGILISYIKIYATDQTDLENYTVLNGYYTQIDKNETNYITK